MLPSFRLRQGFYNVDHSNSEIDQTIFQVYGFHYDEHPSNQSRLEKNISRLHSGISAINNQQSTISNHPTSTASAESSNAHVVGLNIKNQNHASFPSTILMGPALNVMDSVIKFLWT
jgi:hypothetical protein